MSYSATDENGAEQEVARIDADERYRALSNEERRIVLDTLEDTASISLDALATEVATRKSDSRPDERVRISLVHQHLPLLADLGVLEFDEESKRITSIESVLEELLRLL